MKTSTLLTQMSSRFMDKNVSNGYLLRTINDIARGGKPQNQSNDEFKHFLLNFDGSEEELSENDEASSSFRSSLQPLRH